MIIDITKLNSSLEKEITFDFIYSFNREVLEQTEIISLDNVEIKGFIYENSLNNYDIYINVNGVMILPCSVTLEEVEYPFNIKIEGILDELLNEINKNDKKDQNTIDIFPIIWENILMEIPMKVVSEKAQDIKLEGNGWKLITDEEDQININPEFEKLKDLL